MIVLLRAVQNVLGMSLSVLYKIAPPLCFAAVSKVVLHEETIELPEQLETYRHWLRSNDKAQARVTGEKCTNSPEKLCCHPSPAAPC